LGPALRALKILEQLSESKTTTGAGGHSGKLSVLTDFVLFEFFTLYYASRFNQRFSIFTVPKPRDPHSKLRATILPKLPQELHNFVEYEADLGLGCF